MFNPIKTIRNAVKAVTDKDFIIYAVEDYTFPVMYANTAVCGLAGIATGVLYATGYLDLDSKDLAYIMTGEAMMVGLDVFWLYAKRQEYDTNRK